MIFIKEENEYIMSLVESPQMALGNVDMENFITPEKIDFVVNNGKLSAKLGNANLYLIAEDINQKIFSYYVITDDRMLALYYKFKYIDDGGIQTILSYRNPTHKGIFINFFVNFILPTYKRVESDISLSQPGMNFWKNLMDKNGHLNYSVVNQLTGDKKNINNSKELENYYGLDDNYKNFRFVVST